MSATTVIRTAVATAAMLLAGSAATAASAAGTSVARTSRADSPDQRYCVRSDAVTGTRIARVTCQRLADWQGQGVDPRAMHRIR